MEGDRWLTDITVTVEHAPDTNSIAPLQMATRFGYFFKDRSADRASRKYEHAFITPRPTGRDELQMCRVAAQIEGAHSLRLHAPATLRTELQH